MECHFRGKVIQWNHPLLSRVYLGSWPYSVAKIPVSNSIVQGFTCSSLDSIVWLVTAPVRMVYYIRFLLQEFALSLPQKVPLSYHVGWLLGYLGYCLPYQIPILQEFAHYSRVHVPYSVDWLLGLQFIVSVSIVTPQCVGGGGVKRLVLSVHPSVVCPHNNQAISQFTGLSVC